MPLKIADPVDYHDEYRERIVEICGPFSGEDVALMRDEINLKSIENFYRFLRVEKVSQKGDILLLDNGNLKAFWRDDTAFLSLEFMGNNVTRMKLKIKYVKGVRRFHCMASLGAVKGYVASYGISNIIFFGTPKKNRKRNRKKNRRRSRK